MSEPFLAEIRMFAGGFAPSNWAFCNGQLMPIAQNTALFSILGTTYGGDGKTTFALPNLQGRFPLQAGAAPGLSARPQGQQSGSATVTVQTSQMPAHTHDVQGVAARGNRNSPQNGIWAQPGVGRLTDKVYAAGAPNAPTHPRALGSDGTGQPHNNLHPFLAVSFIIALQGVFPSRP